MLIPSATFKQSSGSKFGWPSSFASYAKICHNCPLEFVNVLRLKNLRPRGPLWSFEASKFCRMAAQARWNSLLHAAKKNNNAAKFFVCSKQDNSDGFIGTP